MDVVIARGALHRMRGLGSVQTQSRGGGHEVGLGSDYLVHGPIGLARYVMGDKEPRPGAHEQFIKPLWKQGVGCTVHVWTAREPGRWLLHCHIPHHTLNDNMEEQGGGGLTMIINVTP